jgi:hypothetical protein
MLNELYAASKAVPAKRAAHRWVKPLPKGAGLVACIDRAGRPARFEPLDESLRAVLSKIQKDNFQQFPTINLGYPLLQKSIECARSLCSVPRADARERAAVMSRFVAQAEVEEKPSGALRRSLELALQLEPSFSEAGSFAAFPELIGRLKSITDCPAWLRDVSAALVDNCAKQPELLEIAELLLFGVVTARNGTRSVAPTSGNAKNISIVFDLSDATRFECRVASARMAEFYLNRLQAVPADDKASTLGVCSLSGKRGELERKFPDPTLPVIGPTYLFSMFDEIPSLTRNGVSGAAIFPVSRTVSERMHSTLLWLTSKEMEGKTWAAVPDAAHKQPNLLIAYLRTSPGLDVGLSDFFSGSNISEERTYRIICEEVVRALGGRATRGNDELVDVFVLTRISKGQVQVEISRSYNTAQIVQGAAAWVRATDNHPAIFGVDVEPVSPNDIMRLMRRCWIRNGAEDAKVAGVPLSVVFDLLVAEGDQQRRSAQALLPLVLKRQGPLLVRLGAGAQRLDRKKRLNMKPQERAAASQCVALVSMLLLVLNRRKDVYMQQPAFLLGRFLSLADALHREYCDSIRDGSLPPQLVGNAMLPAAVADPRRGLANMSNRLRVYQAWGATRGTPLARWALKELGRVSAELHTAGLPDRLKDTDKAELLLGYLARPQDKDTKSEGEKNGN